MDSDHRRFRDASPAVLLAAFSIALCLLPAGCLRWPDAPYMDSVASLPPQVAEQLEAAYPGATLTGRVYRMHEENRWDTYRVVDQRFVFQDEAGRFHRASVGEDGSLSVVPAEMLDRLPEALHAVFFDGPSAMVAEGRLSGRVWKFTEASARGPRYEFEFEAGDRRGLGSINESGKFRSAHEFVGSEAGGGVR